MQYLLRYLYVLFSMLLLAQLTACSSDGDEKRQAYLDADYYTRLELPPDLTHPDESRQLSLPEPTGKAKASFKRDSANLGNLNTDKSDMKTAEMKAGETDNVSVQKISQQPLVLPSLINTRLRSEEGIFWLEVDENVDQLWSQLSAFWGHEGIKVVRNEPMLGVIETDWVNKLQVEDSSKGLFARVFQKAKADKLDKFTMRVEPDASKARVYMSHSGLEMSVEGDDVNWRSRCSEEELEREMLQRFALFFGLDEKRAEQAFENYRPYASRIKIPEDEAHVLYVTGTLNFAWKRTLRGLDRLSMNVSEIDAVNSRIKLGIQHLDVLPEGEQDEIAESSWLMQWFTGDDKDSADDPDRQFNLRLSQQNGVVRVEILDLSDQPAEGVLAEQFRNKLAIELQ